MRRSESRSVYVIWDVDTSRARYGDFGVVAEIPALGVFEAVHQWFPGNWWKYQDSYPVITLRLALVFLWYPSHLVSGTRLRIMG